MNNYETLLAEKEALTNRLAEIDREIKNQEKVIYRGKMQKAIDLLKECEPKIHNWLIFDIYKGCENCDTELNIEIYLEDIIRELKVILDNCM